MPKCTNTRPRWVARIRLVIAACGLGLGAGPMASPVAGQESPPGTSSSRPDRPWRGVHLMSPSHGGLPLLKRAIIEKLAPMGVNVLILEVNYNFPFASHPELRGGDLTRDDARDLADTCRKHRIRLIP